MQPAGIKKLPGKKVLLWIADGTANPPSSNHDGGYQKYVILFPNWAKIGSLAQTGAGKIAYQGECVNEKENPRSGSGHGSCLGNEN